MTKIQNTDNTKCWTGCGATGAHSLQAGMQNGTATLEANWQFLTKLIILLSHNSTMAPLDIYPNELKTNVHTKTTCGCLKQHCIFKIYLFVYGCAGPSLAAHGLSLVLASEVYSVVAAHRFQSTGSVIVACGLIYPMACGIFPDQGSNPCPLLQQADSLPLNHQGSQAPKAALFIIAKTQK